MRYGKYEVDVLVDRKLIPVVVYAPTAEVAEKRAEERVNKWDCVTECEAVEAREME